MVGTSTANTIGERQREIGETFARFRQALIWDPRDAPRSFSDLNLPSAWLRR